MRLAAKGSQLVKPGMSARIGPALLSLLSGFLMLGMSFLIPTSTVSESVVCCPRRLVERTVETDESGLLLFWILTGVAAVTVLAAGLFLAGRFTAGSVALGVVIPLTILMPPAPITTGMLIAAVLWAQWTLRRARAAPVSVRAV